jgi:hypothetical protein
VKHYRYQKENIGLILLFFLYAFNSHFGSFLPASMLSGCDVYP